MADLAAVDPWSALLEGEPRPVAYMDEPDLDHVARCCADMVDLKSRTRWVTRPGWAHLAEAAARSDFPTARWWTCEGQRCCTTWARWECRAWSVRRRVR